MNELVAIVIAALLVVETGGERDPASAVGDGGAAVGALQLHPIAVAEANRLEGIEARREGREARTWTDADRYSPDASMEMCAVTLRWHWRRGVHDPVELGARWNRPDGTASERYRNRVREALGGE